MKPDRDPNVPYVPRSIDPDLLAKLRHASEPMALTGTVAQIKWAMSIRTKLLAFAPQALVEVLNAASDSTWWIRNRSKEYVDFNWEALLPKTDKTAPAATATTLALAESAKAASTPGQPKLGWKKLDDRLYVAPLFSWQVIQVFRHGMGGWRWSALGAISTGTFVTPEDTQTAVEEFVRTQFTQALTRL